MKVKDLLLVATISISLFSCGSGKSGNEGNEVVNTHEVTDSIGHKVGKGVAYAKIRIEEPDYISDICKKNFAMWLSTVLEMEKSSDKDAVHSLATTFTHMVSARHEKTMKESQKEFESLRIDEIYTSVDISKVYEDSEYITYIFNEDSFEGGPHGSHRYMGYTFKKSDLSLADLIKPEKVKEYRQAITDSLSVELGVKPSELMETLLIEDDCKQEGLVPLPAGGAYLLGDTLVFQYQQYEIAPYSYGLPCVKIRK